MTKKEIKREMKRILEEDTFEECSDMFDDGRYESMYLGSYMSLDPCGRYHHIISPHGATSKCARYWENLETCAEELGAWIESGEGDPTDIYLCRGVK